MGHPIKMDDDWGYPHDLGNHPMSRPNLGVPSMKLTKSNHFRGKLNLH